MGSFPGTPNPTPIPPGLSPSGNFPPIFLGGAGPITVAAANLGTIAIIPMNTLWIEITLTGFSGSDQLGIRFNGDTGANYVSRFLTAAAGVATLTDAPFVSATAMRLTAAAGTLGAHVSLRINNILGVSKQTLIQSQTTSGAAGTAPALAVSASGEWVNTTAQITSVQVLVVGANNLSVGSSVSIWGTN